MSNRLGIGRNSPCPCGSGKKHKRCCGANADREATTSRTSPEALAAQTYDTEVRRLVRLARRSPVVLEDAEYWNALGIALGYAGSPMAALPAFERAVELESSNLAFAVNRASALADVGDAATALRDLTALPDGAPRRAVMIANVLVSLGRPADAIAWYERAIGEEPSFVEAYRRLLRCLRGVQPTTYGYWLHRAAMVAPEDPFVAYLFATEAVSNDSVDELADADWIDAISIDVNSYQDSDDHRRALVVRLWKMFALATTRHDPDIIRHALDMAMSAANIDVVCEPSLGLANAAANLGQPALVGRAFDLCHPACVADTMRAEYLSHAHRVAGNHAEALTLAEATLARQPTSRLLDVAWWCLEELGRQDEALGLAEQLYQLEPDCPNIRYNLGFLAARVGRLAQASRYYTDQLKHDPYHEWAAENLAFLDLLNGRPVEGEQRLRNAATEKVAAFHDLQVFATTHADSATLSLDLIRFNDSAPVRIGSRMTLPPRPMSVAQLVDSMAHADTAAFEEARRQWAAQARGDFSLAEASLLQVLPEFEALPPAAQAALREAEHRFQEANSTDYAPTVVSFAKAAEITMKIVIFDPFKRRCQMTPAAEAWVAEAAMEKGIETFVKFVRKAAHLEMGAMTLALRRCAGATGTRLALFAELRSFVVTELGLTGLLSDDVTVACQQLATLRNAAAHAVPQGRAYALEARGLVLTVLTVFGRRGRT